MVTQAEAINTAMIGHQMSPLSQQIIAVSVVRSAGVKKKNQFHCPGACNKASLLRQLVFLGFEAVLVRPVISLTVIQLPTFSCQLLAVGSACGLLDLTKVACGPRWASVCVKCPSQKKQQSAAGMYCVCGDFGVA